MNTTKRPALSAETIAATIGRAAADGQARRDPDSVYGPWTGYPGDMVPAVEHVDTADRERLATIAHRAACRRWAELVLERSKRAQRRIEAGLSLPEEEGVAVGMLTADGIFAWPGDRIEWVDPVTMAPDPSPWILRESGDGWCVLERMHCMRRLFEHPGRRMTVSESLMRRQRMWRPS